MSLKALMALALTSLCFLAMATVHIRNREVLLGYRIAELERNRQMRCDHLMALRSEMAGKTALPSLLRKAASLNIRVSLDGFDGVLIDLVPLSQESAGGPTVVEGTGIREDRILVDID
jgi:hypothetical protein